MIKNLVLIGFGVALGVWLADTQPNLANSVRDITESSIDAADQLMKDNPNFSNSVNNIKEQGIDAAGVVIEQVNKN
ncbi:hypothetical protein AB4559_09145 [Vibrio sp. 10N.222.51.C8]|jgi:hypothetical protein|uniref:Uncharacterized protein n=4 Tax=Vibrio TaxID=662 RepID=A0A7Z1MHV1_9VIBR|nr:MULTISPECIES: hypothetical protein [Vibrio]OQQ07361.1 hypothetical protein BK411_13500 [Vibrio splendidus]KAA8675668.1 hypothetical protein F4W18_13680 [Vibrio gigantis]MDC5725637.1 hypothetical protein [Vibrio europaeus]MDC5728239.1 hypothetical protein [Vibrio europaeus]MDC5734451.1 hypothetical protein [Vibrio europaeus]